MQNDLNTETADIIFNAIAHRRSMGLSRLSPAPVDRALIEKMLEAANWGQSNEDTEPWRFTVFSGDGRTALANLFNAAHLEEHGEEPSADLQEGHRKRAYAAPVWISIGMTPALQDDGSMVTDQDEEIMAVATAVQNLHLMASALGLAGMWHSKGLSVNPIVARGLGLTPPSRLLGFFMCGWPSTEWLSGERKPIADKIKWVES